MTSRYEFSFSNFTFGNNSNNPHQNNFYLGEHSTRISSNKSNRNSIINYGAHLNNVISTGSHQEDNDIFNPNLIINNVSQEQVQKIRDELMQTSQNNGINYMTILNLEEKPTNNLSGTQSQGQLNYYTTPSKFQGISTPPPPSEEQANSRIFGEVNNYSTVSQLQQRSNNNMISPQFENKMVTESNKCNMIFPISTDNYILDQINSNEVNNNYLNMMNQNQSINNNANLNNLEDNRNSSYNPNDNYFKSLIEQLVSMEKKSTERMDEFSLKQEGLNNWFRNSSLWLQKTVGELKIMNEELKKDVAIHEKRMEYQAKFTEKICEWIKSRFPEKHPEDSKRK